MSFTDLNVTRLERGITNVAVGDIFNSLLEPDPSKYIRAFEDFITFTSGDYSTGGVGTPTRAAQAGRGGLIRLGTSAASGDNSWIQPANPHFQIVAGKKIFARFRLTVDSASLGTHAAGLQIAVASNNFLTPVNGIFFRKAAGGSTLEFVSRAASVETTSGAIATLTDATQYDCAFFYDGGADLWASVNGTALARITPAALPSVLMGPTIGIQAGSAVARTLDVDQYLVLQER